MSNLGRLHVLTDYHFQQRRTHAELAELAIEGGADVIQFREKYAGVRHALVSARRTADVCAERGVTLIVDDRLDIALSVNADGIHLGQNDLPIHVARRILGDGITLGATATTVEQALRAEREGADYIGFGPVFGTTSKSNPASAKGLDGLARVCDSVSIPVIAIAGITAQRVGSVLDAGAWGVAVMSSAILAPEPSAATRAIREAIDNFLGPN